VLSEGINLHRSNVVINYDIPWNPTRMIQRVGRINRVDTPFNKIYTFNFFPTDQSNDLIKLKEAAVAKINYFIEMLGNDAKLLTDGEEIKSFELFNKLTSKEFITGEDEADESELKYLNVITEIRDKNESLFSKIKYLPKKARSSRLIEDNVKLESESLLTYFRKGKLEKFYLANEALATELDFITTAKLFEATQETKRQKILSNYHALLEKNKTELINNLTEEEIQEAISHRGRDNAIRILKILKSKEIRNYSGFTEIDDEYIKSVIKLLEDGVLPKSVTKRIFGEIKGLDFPPKIISVIKCNLPIEFFTSNNISHDHIMENPSEVILSECFVK
jgi:superfamily II DNA/RNA helicase